MPQIQIQSKLFLDSANPAETKQAKATLPRFDGQTTNPTLVIKNPEINSFLKTQKVSIDKLFEMYKKTITEIYQVDSDLDVSVEVYADLDSKVDNLLDQAKFIQSWNLSPNLRVKFPSTINGIQAGVEFLKTGGKINMTLIFNQEQAMAIDLATKNLQTDENVVISPFVGRLDDIGQNGMDLIRNIKQAYQEQNSKVQILAASIRNNNHILECLKANVDIITAPLQVLQNINQNKTETNSNLAKIPYQQIDTTKNWQNVYKNHDLTNAGLTKFAQDWNEVIDN